MSRRCSFSGRRQAITHRGVKWRSLPVKCSSVLSPQRGHQRALWAERWRSRAPTSDLCEKARAIARTQTRAIPCRNRPVCAAPRSPPSAPVKRPTPPKLVGDAEWLPASPAPPTCSLGLPRGDVSYPGFAEDMKHRSLSARLSREERNCRFVDAINYASRKRGSDLQNSIRTF